MATAAPTSKTDPAVAAATLAHAERRRAMLERLSVLGMVLAEEITQRAVDSPYHPEVVHEPGKAFAQVSRAVRLTLVLEVKMEAAVLAIRNGGGLAASAPSVGPAPWGPLSEADRRDLTRPRRNVRDDDGDEGLVERTRESLTEREDDAFLADDVDGAIEAIRSDLGLAPGWDGRADDEDIAADLDSADDRGHRARSAEYDRVPVAHRTPCLVSVETHPPPLSS